ncbi:hypothetical protein COY17_00935 [Candidatus Saccharibacteria bacterium CG_4_10_14_0_2_um_filter_52_9]|nr:MAG: hypothetical protein COY17_00935 [Candidatus Saccharibacteria bacterium CG_4_10_14_0_2_um_filter_52_9]
MGLIADLKLYLAEKLDVHLTALNKSKKHVFKNTVKAKKGATVNQNVTVLNLGQATKQEKEEALKLLADSFKKGDVLFLDDESRQLVSSVEAAESRESEGSLVNFFRGKLATRDWQILRTGLYIEFLVTQGIPTKEIREGVIRNHGLRGKNLLNLAAAGHFTSHIKPLYEELSKAPGFTDNVFYEEFERILKEMPFAIFVNNTITPDQLTDMIKERAEAAMAYSVDRRKIYVHAWGSNVRTVDVCLAGLDKKYKITASKRIEVIAIVDATIEF